MIEVNFEFVDHRTCVKSAKANLQTVPRIGETVYDEKEIHRHEVYDVVHRLNGTITVYAQQK